MVSIMKEMANKYPKYVKLETSQQKYGIFSPGSCGINIFNEFFYV